MIQEAITGEAGPKPNMGEQAREQAKSADPGLVEKGNGQESTRKNRGWFRRGDPRINRLGRGLKRVPTLAEKVRAWDGQSACPVCSQEPPPKGGQIMTLSVSFGDLRERLSFASSLCPYVLTLPSDAHIVAVEMDPKGGMRVTYRSKEFKPVQVGEPIPELIRHVLGLKNGRSW
jgi:hypothetical protein